MRQTLTVALVVVVLLAGCSAGPGGDATTATETPTSDGTGATTTSAGDSTDDGTQTADGSSGDGASDDSGVDFYISDRPNAISDFDRLDVTVTKVGIHRAGNGSAGGEWLEYDANATVDLTRLLGANASKIGSLDLPNGTYTKVFVYVSDTSGEMNGTDKRVKLPSGKLQLNKGFTVGQGESPRFVFDIAVHEAGKSGKYILSPVVSESGTGDEVRIRDVDREDANEDESENATEIAETAAPQNESESTETATPVTETATPTTETTASGGDETPE